PSRPRAVPLTCGVQVAPQSTVCGVVPFCLTAVPVFRSAKKTRLFSDRPSSPRQHSTFGLPLESESRAVRMRHPNKTKRYYNEPVHKRRQVVPPVSISSLFPSLFLTAFCHAQASRNFTIPRFAGGAPQTEVPAVAVSLHGPRSVAVDAGRNVF